MQSYNFNIENTGEISKLFLANDCLNFLQAQQFIRQLRYGRNANKNDCTTLFADECGTCSTKHVVLKKLAIEQNKTEVRLMLGIFAMNINNTPSIANILNKNNVIAIPEAHNYLRVHHQIIDCTKQGWTAQHFEHDLVVEIEPHQIADWKIKTHQQYLEKWLKAQLHLNMTLDELWQIREQCIATLSN
jgi:hypothetical protein